MIQPPVIQPPTLVCKECGRPFLRLRKDQVFCLATCRSKFHARRYKRTTELYDLAMRWRKKRLKGGFTLLTQMLDGWIRDDREDEAKRKAAKEGGTSDGR